MLFRVHTGPFLYCTVAAIACFFRPVAVNIYTPSDVALVTLAAYVPYRHDSVLIMLVSVLSQFLSSFVPSQDSSTKMIFVKEGQNLKNIKKNQTPVFCILPPNGSCCMTAMVLQLFHPFSQSRHFVLILFCMLVVSRLS